MSVWLWLLAGVLVILGIWTGLYALSVFGVLVFVCLIGAGVLKVDNGGEEQ